MAPGIVPLAVVVWDCQQIGNGPVGREGLRETEVQHLDHPIARDLDVGGLEIAMDDSGGMGGVECVGDLLCDGQRVRERECFPTQPIVQRIAVNELEDERQHSAGVFETVDGPDVRMIERCE